LSCADLSDATTRELTSRAPVLRGGVVVFRHQLLLHAYDSRFRGTSRIA
jgi:hypothetical protein